MSTSDFLSWMEHSTNHMPAAIRTESLHILQVLAGRSGIAVGAYTLDGQVVFANPAYRTLIQSGTIRPIDSAPEACTESDNGSRFQPTGRPALSAGRIQIEAADPYLTLTYPLSGWNGDPTGIAHIVIDSAAVWAPERSTGSGLPQLQAAYEPAPFGVCWIGFDLHYLYVNQAFCRLIGYDLDELYGSIWHRHMRMDDPLHATEALVQLLCGMIPACTLKQHFLRPERTELWVNLHLRLLHDESGRPAGFLGFTEDISAYDRSLETLARRERLQRAQALCSRCLVGGAHDPSDEQAALTHALQALRDGAQVLRVVLFQNCTHPAAGNSARLVAEAWAPGETSLRELGGTDEHYVHWSLVPASNRHALAQGQHIGGPVEMIFAGSPQILAIEHRLGIKASQFFSVFVENTWWGYLGFDDAASRYWDEQEVLLIQTAAEMIGTFLQHNRVLARLHDREAMLRAIGDNLPDAHIYQIEQLADGRIGMNYLSRGLEHRTGLDPDVTRTDQSIWFAPIHPEELPRILAAYEHSRLHKTTFDEEFRYCATDGSVRWLRSRAAPRHFRDGRVVWDGVSYDTTAYHEHSERLQRLNDASRIINSAGLDPQHLYQAIHRAVAYLMPVDALRISLIERSERFVEHVYASGIDHVTRGTSVPIEGSFVEFMQSYGPSLRIDDITTFAHAEIAAAAFDCAADARAVVAASFVTSNKTFGLLFVQSCRPGDYNDDQRIMLELLAAHAATAIENVRRAQHIQRIAIDGERNRLARDLHDSVSQSLFSASMIAERLPAMARIDANQAWEGLEKLHQLVRNAQSEMRALLMELRPASLGAAPLHQALQLLANTTTSRAGIAVNVLTDPAPPLPELVQVAFYRIAQECLSNSIRHAAGTAAGLRLIVTPQTTSQSADWNGTVTLIMHDNGCGFDSRTIPPGHFGLMIMRDRAHEIGAHFEISSTPGSGTEVRLIWHGSALAKEGELWTTSRSKRSGW
jgi:PAS domain S-box-containing protein